MAWGDHALTDIPWLFIVSGRRMGTTQTVALLDALDGIAVFHELFDPRYPTHLDARSLGVLRRASGIDARHHHDSRLGRWIAQDRSAILQLMQETAPRRTAATCIKLFQHHVDLAAFKRVLVDHPRSHFIFLRRKPIDSYISLRKALLSNTWYGVDTTDDPVTLDAELFLRWHRDQAIWFRDTSNAVNAAGRPCVDLTYERDLLIGERETVARLRTALRAFDLETDVAIDRRIKLAIRNGANRLVQRVGLPPPLHERLGTIRQDRTRERREKVSNWDEFVAAVERIPDGCERLETFDLSD